MPTKTKDSYRVVGQTAPELNRELNFLFQRIADRLDAIEGIRGSAAIERGLTVSSGPMRVKDADGELIHSLESSE